MRKCIAKQYNDIAAWTSLFGCVISTSDLTAWKTSSSFVRLDVQTAIGVILISDPFDYD